VNLRQLNYILIRGDARNWERWARHPLARMLRPLVAPLLVLTEEGYAVLVLAMLAGAAGMDVQFSNLYLLFCGLIGLLVAAWVGRVVFARPGALQVALHHPPRVAVGAPVAFTLELVNPGPRALFALRAWGPFLSWDGKWVDRRPAVPRLAAGETVKVEASARFLARGHHWVGRFQVASTHPLGLAVGRKLATEAAQLVVVPRTVRLRHLAPPPLVPDDLGEARGVTSGADYELAGLRPYRPGDRIRDLHAFSWARLGEPMVRTFRHTARRKAVVVLHTAAPRVDEAAFEAAVTFAASLVRWAIEHGAATTLLVAGDPLWEVRVGPQGAPETAALDILAAVQPCTTAAREATGRIAQLRAGHIPIYFVFCAFGPHVVGPGPGVQSWVAGDRASRTAAQAAGIPVLSPADVAALGAVS